MNNENKNKTENEVKTPKEDLLAEYSAQTEKDENIHFEHCDWTYNDSSCCC